jgi:hypothetical protein
MSNKKLMFVIIQRNSFNKQYEINICNQLKEIHLMKIKILLFEIT